MGLGLFVELNGLGAHAGFLEDHVDLVRRLIIGIITTLQVLCL